MMLRNRIENVIVNDMTPKQVRYLQPVLPAQASGKLAGLYQQARRDFQLVPPITLFSPVPDLLAALWSIARESQIVTGRVSRQQKEAVAAAVSQINTCPYCVDAHIGLLHGAAEHDLADAILGAKTEQITDAEFRAITNWALATRTPESALLARPPFTAEQAPEIIGTALAYHFLNRMVSLFLSSSPLPVKGGLPKFKKVALKLFGVSAGKSMVSKTAQPGDSLIFLPKAHLPDDFAWAQPNPDIAAAFAGFSALMETAGDETVPDPVRERVLQRLAHWRGEDMGLGCQWLEEATAGLPDSQQAMAHLVMLAAFAPYQANEKVILAFRKQYTGDAELLAAASWASYAATRRISQWLQPALTLTGENP